MSALLAVWMLLLGFSIHDGDGRSTFSGAQNQSWRDAMRREGVRRVRALVDVGDTKKPDNMKLEHIIYYSDYDVRGSQISDSKRVQHFFASGLADQLKEAAFQQALASKWLAQGYRFVSIDLLDDPELPAMGFDRIKQHLRDIAQTLPSDNFLRQMLERGAYGNGLRYPWMDAMRHAKVRNAVVLVAIKFRHSGRPGELGIARIQYFEEYESEASRITDAERLEKIRSSGLEQMLQDVALERSKRGFWAPHPPRPRPRPFVGGTRVTFYDDEWLPHPIPTFWAGPLPTQ